MSVLCAALPPSYWFMQIGILLRNRDYQGDSEFLRFCGSQKEHTIIGTHFSSFYLRGEIKLKVFRCFLPLSICIMRLSTQVPEFPRY